MLAFLVFFAWRVSPWACLVLMIPLVLDGFRQKLTAYESTNRRRLVTGVLFGYGLYTLFAHSTVWAFQFGYNLL